MVPPRLLFNFRSGKVVFRYLCGSLPRVMSSRRPLRVLCLAGFRQSERGFREKTGALRKALRGRAELVCLSGPHPVPDGAGPDSGERSANPYLGNAPICPLRFPEQPQIPTPAHA